MGVRAHGVETVSTIAFEKDPGETSGSRLIQRQNDSLMVPNPRENSRRGRLSRQISGKLAHVGEIFPRIVSVRSNSGETSSSSFVQRQKYSLMVPNSRENSRGGRISRETSGKLAHVGEIFPIIVSVRSNSGETSGCSLVQRQKVP